MGPGDYPAESENDPIAWANEQRQRSRRRDALHRDEDIWVALDKVRTELVNQMDDIYDIIVGKPAAGWTGMTGQVKELLETNKRALKRLDDVETAQRSLERVQREEVDKQKAKDALHQKRLNRAIAAMITIMTGIVIQLFTLLFTSGVL